MNTTEKFYEIMNGPGKDLIFDACKYAYSKTGRIEISFSVAVGYTLQKDNPSAAYVAMETSDWQIVAIENEDGSGERFNLRGYCAADTERFSKGEKKRYRFNAYYNVRTRKGTIAFSN